MEKSIRILTPSGFQDFAGIRRKWSNSCIDIVFTDGSRFTCTQDHRFVEGTTVVFAHSLAVGHVLNNRCIASITLSSPQYVYDVLEVNGHEYFSDNLVSHNCEFLGSSGTLISGAMLKIIQEQLEIPMHTDQGLAMYHHPVRDHIYVMTCDVSRGKQLDYSTFQVIDVSTTPYRQVCRYQNNTIQVSDFAAIIDRIAKYYNMAQVLVENNDNGGAVLSVLHLIHEYENLLWTENAGVGNKQISAGFAGSNAEMGIRTQKNTKAIGCAMIKAIVEARQLAVIDSATLEELKTFSAKGVSYEAEEGKHDDLVMPLVLFGWMSNQPYFKQLTDDDVMQRLKEKTDEEIEDYLFPFGVIDDGINHTEMDMVDSSDFVSGNQFDSWMNS